MLGRYVDWGNPVSENGLNVGLATWHLQPSPLFGAAFARDLTDKYPGALTGGPTWVPGQNGFGALSLDGSDDYIDVNPIGETGQVVTLSFWAKPTDTTNNQYVCQGNDSDGTNNVRAIILGFQDGFWNIFNNGYPTGTAADTQITATAGVWQHVTFACDGSTLQGYLNGVRQYSVSANLNTAGSIPGVFRRRWGTSGSADWYAGQLSDIRVYTTALTGSQVSALYEQGLKGHPNTLRRFSRKLFVISQQGGGGGGTFTASAAVTVNNTTCAGSASFSPGTKTATGACTVSNTICSGSASFSPGTKTATAAVSASNATCAGTATFAPGTKTATGACTVNNTTCTGSASFSPGTKTASAAVTVSNTTAAGTAIFDEGIAVGTGAVTASNATCSGSATFAPGTKTASAAVQVANTTCAGSASFTGPAGRTATGAALISNATCAGVAAFTAPPNRTAAGAVTASNTTCQGFAFTSANLYVAQGVVTVSNATVSGIGTVSQVGKITRGRWSATVGTGRWSALPGTGRWSFEPEG